MTVRLRVEPGASRWRPGSAEWLAEQVDAGIVGDVRPPRDGPEHFAQCAACQAIAAERRAALSPPPESFHPSSRSAG